MGLSDLNAPYSLPRAGCAAVLAGDAGAARAALAQLDGIGTRGRAVDADRTVIRAGIAAIEGDESAASAGYRTAIDSFRGLGLPWDEALAGLSAAIRLGSGVSDVSEWVESARRTFVRFEAAPLVALLDAMTGPPRRDAASGLRPEQRDAVTGNIASPT
jgi:hypothetical protein